jgi:hypothetical protein
MFFDSCKERIQIHIGRTLREYTLSYIYYLNYLNPGVRERKKNENTLHKHIYHFDLSTQPNSFISIREKKLHVNSRYRVAFCHPCVRFFPFYPSAT